MKTMDALSATPVGYAAYVQRAQLAARAAAKASAIVASVAGRQDSGPAELPSPQPTQRLIGLA